MIFAGLITAALLSYTTSEATLMQSAAVTQAPEVVGGPFLVFFNWQSGEVTPEAGAIFDSLLSQCANASTPARRIVISVASGRDGSDTRQVILARLRAAINYMRTSAPRFRCYANFVLVNEILPDRIRVRPGTREVQNRRLEITFSRAMPKS